MSVEDKRELGELWCPYCGRFWPIGAPRCSCSGHDFRYVSIELIEKRYGVELSKATKEKP